MICCPDIREHRKVLGDQPCAGEKVVVVTILRIVGAKVLGEAERLVKLA
jgi:hypothetical protein